MYSIELYPAQRDELQCIENLMQFYLYDFSEWLPLKFGAHGFFDFQPMQDYWQKPGTRPFLIKVNGEIAGFVTVDGNVHFPDVQYNIGYFFISRRFRGQGIGRRAVAQLLNGFPGQWQIVHIQANQAARLFWARVIPPLANGALTRHNLSVDGYACTLYRFQCMAEA